MNHQHTPGPWEVNQYPEELVVSSLPHGAYVAKCDGISATIGSSEELIANARLIAAAPDLLAACQAIIARVDAPGGTIRSIRGEDVAALRAAIAKAGGEA